MKPILNERKKTGDKFLAVALINIMLALAACGEKPQTPVPQPTPSKLYQQERGALEKAKGVEQAQAKSAEDLRRETEKQAQ